MKRFIAYMNADSEENAKTIESYLKESGEKNTRLKDNNVVLRFEDTAGRYARLLRDIHDKFGSHNIRISIGLRHSGGIVGLTFPQDIAETDIKDFLENPRDLIFPNLAQCKEGALRALDNSWSLLMNSEILHKKRQHRHSVYFLILGMEEIGKAILLIENAKTSEKQNLTYVKVEGFRKHTVKMEKLINELWRWEIDPSSEGYVSFPVGALHDWIEIVKHADKFGREGRKSYQFEFEVSKVETLETLSKLPDFEVYARTHGISDPKYWDFARRMKESYPEPPRFTEFIKHAIYLDYNGQSMKWYIRDVKNSCMSVGNVPPLLRFLRIVIAECKESIQKADTYQSIESITQVFRNIKNLDLEQIRQKLDAWLKLYPMLQDDDRHTNQERTAL